MRRNQPTMEASVRADRGIKQVLRVTQSEWDCPSYDPYLRAEYRKVLNCGTAALGGEVFASGNEERVVYHTCKSRICPSCGNRATIQWQQEQDGSLPDIVYRGVVLTLPVDIQEVFRTNAELTRALPILGAKVLELCAMIKHQAKMLIIVVPHTFGGRLTEHFHLHIMFSAGGLLTEKRRWLHNLALSEDDIRDIWRREVLAYLASPTISESIRKSSPDLDLQCLLGRPANEYWHIYLARNMSKNHFVKYAGRYIRRAPISQSRILSVSETQVVYVKKLTRIRSTERAACSPSEFLRILAKHFHPRYRHSMRYFGLCSPRNKHLTEKLIFDLLGQGFPTRQRPICWAESIERIFGLNPLLDSTGERMRWRASLPANPN